MKVFAHNKLNVVQKMTSVFKRVENIVGKGENACYQHFLLFPPCFQKLSSSWPLKVWIVLKMVNVMGKAECVTCRKKCTRLLTTSANSKA